MIYINLLPVRKIKARIAAKRQVLMSSCAFVVFLVFLIMFALYQSGIISELQEKERKIQEEKKHYVKIVNQIKSIDEEKKVLETRISVIKSLKQESSLTVRVLDEIATLTPSNRMWLKSLNQESSNLTLFGMALDDQTIAKYMDDLDRSSYIKSVSLANTTMDKYADRDLKSFSVSCTVGFESKKDTVNDTK
ncbi:PilN domain-containing protein [Desulfobulbus propionicus]